MYRRTGAPFVIGAPVTLSDDDEAQKRIRQYGFAPSQAFRVLSSPSTPSPPGGVFIGVPDDNMPPFAAPGLDWSHNSTSFEEATRYDSAGNRFARWTGGLGSTVLTMNINGLSYLPMTDPGTDVGFFLRIIARASLAGTLFSRMAIQLDNASGPAVASWFVGSPDNAAPVTTALTPIFSTYDLLLTTPQGAALDFTNQRFRVSASFSGVSLAQTFDFDFIELHV